jgi:hypothetical protein
LTIYALVLVLSLSGCATQISPETMVPSSVKITKNHAESISIIADSGSETEAIGKLQISNVALRRAVVDAINQTKTFSMCNSREKWRPCFKREYFQPHIAKFWIFIYCKNGNGLDLDASKYRCRSLARSNHIKTYSNSE